MTKTLDYLAEAYRSILENDFEQTIHWFDKALELSPQDADIHYRCSVTCTRSSRLEKAIHHARAALDLEPDTEEYHLHYERLLAMDLTRKALKVLEHGSRTESSVRAAVIDLEQAVKLDPLSSKAYIGLAVAYSELKEYTFAINSIREAIHLLEGDSSIHELRLWEQRIETYIDQSSS